jgi:hypothetical protein
MKIKITVEAEIHDDKIDVEYYDGKLAETLAAFQGQVKPADAGLDITPQDILKWFARDVLDVYHGLPKSCLKSWNIVEVSLSEEKSNSS